jgi:hypothetical protein
VDTLDDTTLVVKWNGHFSVDNAKISFIIEWSVPCEKGRAF